MEHLCPGYIKLTYSNYTYAGYYAKKLHKFAGTTVPIY